MSLLGHGRTRIIGTFCFLTLISYVLLFQIRSASRSWLPIRNTSSPSESQSFLHLLIPAEGTDPGLCKFILGATLLGYPAPVLIHWDDHDGTKSRIHSVLAYLTKDPAWDDGDLVLILNGFDNWFQLSPKLLIDRYHEINNGANKEILASQGKDAEHQRIEQSILFGSKRNCTPYAAEGKRCSSIKRSPFPQALHGSREDVQAGKGNGTNRKNSESVPDANFVIGPVREMRLMFEQAKELWEAKDGESANEEDILAQIWVEQQDQRHNDLGTTTVTSISTSTSTPTPSTQTTTTTIPSSSNDHLKRYIHPARRKDDAFTIGLDYANALFSPPVELLSTYPMEFLIHANTTALKAAFASHGFLLPEPPPTLHPDVAADSLPFSTLAGSTSYEDPQQGYLGPSSTKWEHVPLYTDLWTGVTPVIIPQQIPIFLAGNSSSPIHRHHHHSEESATDAAQADAQNARSIWFLPRARKLLTAILRHDTAAPDNEAPIAIEGKIRHGRKWFGITNRATAFQETGSGFGVVMAASDGGNGIGIIKGWEEICEDVEVQEDSFDDGQGEWEWEDREEAAPEETEDG